MEEGAYMNEKKIEHLERIKEAVQKSDRLEDMEKSLILEKIEEWKHDDEAMSLIPAKLTELSQKIVPILEEIGLM